MYMCKKKNVQNKNKCLMYYMWYEQYCYYPKSPNGKLGRNFGNGRMVQIN